MERTISSGLLAGFYLTDCFAPGRDPEIVTALQADPELGGVAEVAAQAKGCVGGDAALAAHQVIYAWSGDMKLLGQPVGGETEGFHKLGEENFAGMDRKCYRKAVHSPQTLLLHKQACFCVYNSYSCFLVSIPAVGVLVRSQPVILILGYGATDRLV